MTDSDIDKQVADLIDALQQNDTQAITADNLPENDFFFSLSEENHQQVIGHKVGQWQVDKLLGEGGMSVVYQVSRSDDHIQQNGALKVISDRFVYSSFKDRFLKERQILTDLNHPNIVKLLDAGITKSGIPWYVMEYIEGQDIKSFVNNNGLNTQQIIDLIIPVCKALICAHQFDVVHRDVKPSNVIISQDGQVKLFDFGIAHVIDEQSLNMTKTGVIIGTPGYMSPEQAKGQSSLINQSTDVFAVGVMICELLTGSKPFMGEDVTEISYATIHHEPVINSSLLDQDLIAIIYKCLQKNPVQRYPDVESLKQDLMAYQNAEVVSARRITWNYRLRKLMQRHPNSSAVISVLIFSTLMSIGYGIYQFYHNQQQLLFTEQVVNQAYQISSEIQQSNLLPLHDIQKTHNSVSKKATDLADQLKSNPSLAGGSAYTALGMAFLAMRDAENAEIQFEEAEKLNHQSTTLSRGIGLLLSQKWRIAMDKKPDTQRINSLKSEIYVPMMLHFNKASEDQDFRHFILGNVAYLEDDYERAIEKFDLAYLQNPGFYDALRMKSEVQLLKWQNQVRKDGYASTLSLLQSSNDTLQQAIEIGRSDPWNYVSLCANKSAEIQVLAMTQKTEQMTQAIKAADQVCQDALLLDPKAKSPWTNRSIVLMTGLGLSSDNKEKQLAYQEVIDWLDQAIDQHPSDERLLLSQIRPLMNLASLAIEQASSPIPYFDHALNKLQQVKEINNDSSNRRMFNEFGRVYYSKAEYDVERHNHPSAIENYLMALQSYEASQTIQSQNNIIFNIATVESELHDSYTLTGASENAYQALKNSIQRRIPILTENTESYYPQLLDLLASMLNFETIYIDSDLKNTSFKDDYIGSFQLACGYQQKTQEQLKTLNQLYQQWLNLYPETILEPCPINP